MNNLIPVEIEQKVLSTIESIIKDGAIIEKISTYEQANNASIFLSRIKKYNSEIEDEMEELVRPYNSEICCIEERRNEIKRWFDGKSIIIEKIERNFKAKIFEYQSEQKKIAEQKQREAEAIARKEREKKETEAREQREKERILLAEAARIAELARKEQDTKKQEEFRKEQEKNIRMAAAAAAKAEEKTILAESMVAPIINAAPTKIGGFYTTTKHSGECTNIVAFSKWCVENNKTHMLQPVQKMLDAYIKSSSGQEQIPGIKNIMTHSQVQRQR